MRMLCYKCGHSWNYKGKLFYITCPSCSYKIRKDKALIESVESKQELLTILPKKEELPTRIPKKLPTTSFERVYFPDGFDCLVHKNIAAQFRKLTLNDLQEEKPVIEFVIDRQSEEIKEFDNISDFHLEIQKEIIDTKEWKEMGIEVSDPNSINGKKIVMKKYKELGVPITIKALNPSLPSQIKEFLNRKAQERDLPKEKPDFEIRVIPRDPIKLLEHQRSFF